MASSRLEITRTGEAGPRFLFIEPYLAASHRALARGLMRRVPGRWTLAAMPGRHFRWRMRGAASWLATEAADALAGPWDALIVSSMLNLAELRGLLPGLAGVPTLVYFHENQITYPTPGRAGAEQQRRDLYLAFSNVTSALAADLVVFNSDYHRRQFVEGLDKLLAGLPDYVPHRTLEIIQARSMVLPVPLEDPFIHREMVPRDRDSSLRLVWNHRWEHDKGPEEFFEAVFHLAGLGLDFEVAVLGQRAARWPAVFDQAGDKLGQRLVQLGPVCRREEYWNWLDWADVVVSTAHQEFLGLAVAEGVLAGCRPLTPRDLSYQDLYPDECFYERGSLTRTLGRLIENPASARNGDWRRLALCLTWARQETAWRETLTRLVGAADRARP